MLTQKNYICEFCEKEFSNSHAKAGHIRGHKVNSSEIMSKVWERENFREKRKASLERVQTPEYWVKVCQGVQKHWDTHPERKQETSERLSAEWKDPNSKRRKTFASQGHKQKMSNIKIEQSKNKEYLKQLSLSHKIWYQNLSEKERFEFLNRIEKNRKIRCKYTSIENKLYNALLQNNLQDELFQQYKVITKERVCFIDLCYPKQKLAIECYGDYWHSNPIKYNKLDKVQKSIKNNDMTRIKILNSLGFKVLTFFETDINKNLKSCIDTIQNELSMGEHFLTPIRP